MNKKLTIADSTYGAILSAGTFTHGHVGPNVLGELLRIVKPEGLFVISIHKNIFVKKGFKKTFENLGKKITNLNFHKVDIYGKKKIMKKSRIKYLLQFLGKVISSGHQ